MSKEQLILIIGAGSIGERHIRNLWTLGYHNLLVYRQRNLPFRDIGEARVNIVLNWNEAMERKPFAAIVCTPTVQHQQQTVDCLKHGIHVLVEKPMSHQPVSVYAITRILEQHNAMLQVAYMLRYHPLLQKVKQLKEEKVYGNLVNIQTYWGEYLPDWHPWEDYRLSYAAMKELGGGAALTLSHDIDVANWIANGSVKRFASFPNHHTHLEVNTDAAFDLNIAYDNRITAHIHTNFCQPVPQRWYKFVFDKAVVDIDYYQSKITIATKEGSNEEVISNFDRNDMFLAQTQDFFARIEQNNYLQYSIDQLEESAIITQMCTHEQ